MVQRNSLYILGNLVSVTKSQHFLSSEIQLKSPNWLFGQRKYEESGSAPKVASREIAGGGSQADGRVDCLCDLNWLSSASDINEEDVFQRYFSRKCIFIIHICLEDLSQFFHVLAVSTSWQL